MIAPFLGVCPTCQHDHGGDFLEDEPSIDQYRSLYFAQCAKTDELVEEVKKKSDVTLLAKIKELEAQIVALNKTITERNIALANSPQADDVRKDALEQAAKIAEQMPLNCDEEHHAYRFSDDSKAIAWDIAHAIRQAIDKARE